MYLLVLVMHMHMYVYMQKCICISMWCEADVANGNDQQQQLPCPVINMHECSVAAANVASDTIPSLSCVSHRQHSTAVHSADAATTVAGLGSSCCQL